VVSVWTDPIPPTDDLGLRVYASCPTGVLAAELDLFDLEGDLIPKSFDAVAAFAAGWR